MSVFACVLPPRGVELRKLSTSKLEVGSGPVTTRKGVPYSIFIPSLVLLSNPLPTTSMIQILAKEAP